MKKDKKRLPDSELEVMQMIWQSEIPVSRMEIERRMQEKHPMAQTTLLTLLSRLAKKDFIKIEKQGRCSYYYPLVSQADYCVQQSHHFFTTLFGGNISAFASSLCDGGLTQAELAELRTLLEQEDHDV